VYAFATHERALGGSVAATKKVLTPAVDVARHEMGRADHVERVDGSVVVSDVLCDRERSLAPAHAVCIVAGEHT
jgi:hypothetical protein